jgi:hypothetical protein
LFSRGFDQVNPFDSGRTFKQEDPTNNRSVFGQATHNAFTNAGGDYLFKPVANMSGAPSAIDAARLGVGELTHNQGAIDGATTRLAHNLPQVLPVALASATVPFAQKVASAVLAPVEQHYENQQEQYAQRVLGKAYEPFVAGKQMADAESSAIKNQMQNEYLHKAGINQNDSTGTLVRKTAGDAAQTAASIAMAGRLPGLATAGASRMAGTFAGLNAASAAGAVSHQDNPTLKDYAGAVIPAAAMGAALPVGAAGVRIGAELAGKGLAKTSQGIDRYQAYLGSLGEKPYAHINDAELAAAQNVRNPIHPPSESDYALAKSALKRLAPTT